MRLLSAVLVLVVAPAFAQDLSARPPSASPDAPAASDTSGAFSPVDPPRPVASTLAPDAPLTPVAMSLAALTQDPIFASAAVSAQVVDLSGGAEVWSFGDDEARMPASTMKLLTAATALHTLGPAWRFPTWIMRTGEIGDDGVLDGTLYVKGQGDPTMVVERMYRMLLDVRLQGVREVKGDVVFDEGYFADSTLVPGWTDAGDLVDGPTYYAPLGALSVNYNLATVHVRPAATVGHPAVVELDVPHAEVVVENSATTVSAKSRLRLKIDRTLDPKDPAIVHLKVTGNVPVDEAPHTYYRTVASPTAQYRAAFVQAAKSVGIKVKGPGRVGATPADAKLLLRVDSEPLAEILGDMNKHSNNFMAEQVLRAVGAETQGLPATTAKGLTTMRAYLASLGVGDGQDNLVNGSGLSRIARVRPSTINRVLVDMWTSPDVGPEFVAGLSVGGRDGTLRGRFRESGLEGRVRGKTGTLDGVACLAGFVSAADGTSYAYSVLVNDIDGAVSRAKHATDELVLTLAGVGGRVADTDDGEDAAP